MDDIDAMRQAVEAARKTASTLKIKATKARIAAQNDKKSETKAVASTKAKDAASEAKPASTGGQSEPTRPNHAETV